MMLPDLEPMNKQQGTAVSVLCLVNLGVRRFILQELCCLLFILLGGSDLFPGPGAGMFPSRGGFVGGGSMLLGPNDPSWFGGLREPGFPGGQPAVPPGARFDPFGPPDVPGFEPGLFVRNPRRPGGNAHPDLEHFRRDSDFI
ncbi:hypothetical protein MLD38_021120 [Melastoma candidum]|uniref:Uncharacterized protein n=1 Tax=Melastoma candidum TaxID=119954 RepID=A0ACB9QF97_9MYRT|nr:hypothetical protein MLD38_021120 [Melastoma candidum]